MAFFAQPHGQGVPSFFAQAARCVGLGSAGLDLDPRSKGSTLVAGIVHAATNTAFAFLPTLDWAIYNWIAGVAALVLALAGQMWKKLSPDHPAVYQALAVQN